MMVKCLHAETLALGFPVHMQMCEISPQSKLAVLAPFRARQIAWVSYLGNSLGKELYRLLGQDCLSLMGQEMCLYTVSCSHCIFVAFVAPSSSATIFGLVQTGCIQYTQDQAILGAQDAGDPVASLKCF